MDLAGDENDEMTEDIGDDDVVASRDRQNSCTTKLRLVENALQLVPFQLKLRG